MKNEVRHAAHSSYRCEYHIIKNQLEEDYAKDQISLKEFADPITGERNK